MVEGDIELPCNVIAAQDDRVAVILWYRGDHPDAMYTYDARNDSPPHREHMHTYGDTRTRFYPNPPAKLVISKATLEDAGKYECRVDFMRAPSKTTILNVTVIAPPTSIEISNYTGRPVTSIITVSEDESLRLSCIVTGGYPQPLVWWTRKNRSHDVILDEADEIIGQGLTLNDLEIPRLTPDYHQNQISCNAGHNRTAQLSERITLLLNMAPKSVSIMGLPSPLQAGKRYKVWCEALGSRPAPTLTWSLKKIERLEEILDTEELAKRNVSKSWIEIRVDHTFEGATLKCKAASPELPKRFVVNSTVLDVNFIPKLYLTLGRMLKSDGIKEGMDVYLHCSVAANPKVYKVTWYHNEEEVRHNKSAGVIVSSDHLVLQKIAKRWSGHYVCKASNVVGDAISNRLSIIVQYAPICNTPPNSVYRAALGEEISLLCRVLSHPPNVTFSWTFMNALTEHERVPGDRVTWTRLESRLRYLPEKLQDYGTFHCWATNTVDNQAKPCVFTVKPAGVPSAPLNCKVSNQTWESVEVTCGDLIDHSRLNGVHLHGYQGHLNFTARESNDYIIPSDQTEYLQDSDKARYLLTVRERVGHSVVHNVTGDRGIFSVAGLTPGLDYVISVRTFNSHGRSPVVTLEAFTLRTAENRMREEEDSTDSTVLGVIVGVMGVGLILAVGAIIISLRSRSRPRPSTPTEGTRLPPGDVASDSGGLDHPDLLEAENHGVPSTAYRAVEVTQALLPTSRPTDGDMHLTPASVSPTAHLEYLSCEGPDSISPSATVRMHPRLYVRAEGHMGHQESFL